ncbi:MAG: pseudouridine synthase [Pirellulales bacterium]
MNRYESGRHSRDGRGQGPNRFSSNQGSKRKPSRRRSAQNFPKAPDPRGERLQKVLAAAGIGSRRDCEELITAGRVEVDKEIVTVLGTRVHADTQEIRVDGTPIKTPKKHYFLVNKPVGVVTTNYDPSGRTRVIDLAPTQDRVFPVGRLDRSSEGLIIVTNDGEFANLLTHPRYGVPKTYLVRVAGAPTSEDLFKLRKGIYLSDGFCRIESVKIKSRHGQSTDLIMILNEGKNREIRRVLAKLGHKVVRLKGLSVGTLKLGEVPTGAWRVLTPSEIEKLRQLALADAPRAKSADESGSAPARERGESAESSGPALTTEITDATEISDSLTASDLSSLGSDELDNELAGLLSAEDEDFSGADFTEVDESELEEEFGTMDEWPEDDAEEAPSPKKAREKKPKKQRPARAAFSEDASDEDQEAMAEMEDEESSLELGEDFELSSDAEELAQDFGMDDGDDDLDDDLEELLGDDFQVTRGKAPGANAGNVLDYEGEEGEASSEDASDKPRRAPRPDFDGPRPERGPRPDRGGPRGRFRDDRGPRDRGPRDYDRGPRDRGESRGPRSFGDRPRFGGRDRGGRDDRGPRGGGFRPRGNDQGRGYGPPGQDRFPRRQAREFGPEDGFGMNRQEGAEGQQGPGEGQSEQSFDRPRRPYRSGPGGGPGRGGPRGGDFAGRREIVLRW